MNTFREEFLELIVELTREREKARKNHDTNNSDVIYYQAGGKIDAFTVAIDGLQKILDNSKTPISKRNKQEK